MFSHPGTRNGGKDTVALPSTLPAKTEAERIEEIERISEPTATTAALLLEALFAELVVDLALLLVLQHLVGCKPRTHMPSV